MAKAHLTRCPTYFCVHISIEFLFKIMKFVLTVCPLTSCAVSMMHIKLCVSSNTGFRLIFLSNIAIHKIATLLKLDFTPKHHQETNENKKKTKQTQKNINKLNRKSETEKMQPSLILCGRKKK